MTTQPSTEVAVRESGSALSLTSGQEFWNEKQVAALRQLGVKDFTNGDLAVFFHQCQRTGLDPFARQIYMLSRWTKDGPKQTIQTGIDGYRLIARRVCDQRNESLEYEDTLWCGKDGGWEDVWLSTAHPAAAKVTVLRGGRRFSAVALWEEFLQTNKDDSPTAMWQRMGANQLAKCAEAAALRKAFPQDLSGIYTDTEMGQADAPSAPAPQPVDGLRARAAVAAKPAPPSDAGPPEPAEATPETEPASDRYDPWEIKTITKAQSAKLHASMSDLGIVDRDRKLEYVANVVGRQVESSNELTKDEASQVIEALTMDAEQIEPS